MSLLSAVLDQVRALLPRPWTLDPPVWNPQAMGLGDERWVPDASVVLRAGRASVRFLIEAKTNFEPRQAMSLPDLRRWKRLDRQADTELQDVGGGLLVAPYVSPRARVLLMTAGWSFADLAGNARLVSTQPPLFVMTSGPQQAPRGAPYQMRSLRGISAGRLVRTLADFQSPLAFRDVATRAKVSLALVSRLVALLERDALVEREGRGVIRVVEWPGLLRRWAEDYGFLRSNLVTRFMALRGRTALIDLLRKTPRRYAITGGVAAEQMRTSAPTPITAIYTDRVAELARELELEPVPDNPSVLLAEPWDDVVFERTFERSGLKYAAPTQVVADLLTSGDRYPMVAESVIDWMKDNEREWRH